MAITLNDKHLASFVRSHELDGMAPLVKAAHEMLHNKTGLGNDFLGWVELPTNYDKEEFARIQKAAEKIKKTPMCWWLSASAAPTWALVPSSKR